MIVVVLNAVAGADVIGAVAGRLRSIGLSVQVSRGAERTVLIVLDGTVEAVAEALAGVGGVERVQTLTRPYRLAAREMRPEGTRAAVGGLIVGAGRPVIIAGPLSPFGRPMGLAFARTLKDAGVDILRAGVYRPPAGLYSAPVLDTEALGRLADLRRDLDLPVAIAPLTAEDVPLLARTADLLVLGSGEAADRALLHVCGYVDRPVVLTRGGSWLIDEWLLTADEILGRGNHQVILAAGGIRAFDTELRGTLDLSAIPMVKRRSHLPVAAELGGLDAPAGVLESLALAAAGAGADGLLLDVREGQADEPGVLGLGGLGALLSQVQKIAAVLRSSSEPA